MNYWNKICTFITIFFLTAPFLAAQTPGDIKPEHAILFTGKGAGDTTFLASRIRNKSFKPAISTNTIIIQDYYTTHIGFICKKELAVEKITKIPLRLRLGSLQQCNYLEGKK